MDGAADAQPAPLRRRFAHEWAIRRSRWADLFRRRLGDRELLPGDQRGYRMRRLLALADCVAILGAGGVLIALDALTAYPTAPNDPLLLGPIGLALWVALAGITGMYHVDEKRLDCSIADEIGRVIQVTAVWTWGLFLVDTLGAPGSTPVTPALSTWIVAVPAILAARALVREVAQRRPWYQQSALVIGSPGDAERVTRVLGRHPEYGVNAVRSLVLDAGMGIGRIEGLIDLIEQSSVDRVIFASSYEGLDERTGALRFLSDQGIKVDLVPGDSEVFRSDAELHFIEGLPLLTLPTTRRPRSAAFMKRVIDVAAASVGIIVLSPVLGYIAIRIKCSSPGSVLFRQRRVGKDGAHFHVFKFRTMTADADDRKHQVEGLNGRTDGMFKVSNDPRITRFGATLRRYSLDELPQLINIVRGEMSLVGPRPLIEVESDLVAELYLARFKVRPGITGPWQVLGRSDIPFEDMLKLDYMYVTSWSIADDVKWIVRTFGAMANGKGAY